MVASNIFYFVIILIKVKSIKNPCTTYPIFFEWFLKSKAIIPVTIIASIRAYNIALNPALEGVIINAKTISTKMLS